MDIIGRKTVRALWLACAGAAVLSVGAALADNYPSRPVTVVVPFTPGRLNRHPGALRGRRAAAGSCTARSWSRTSPGAGGEIGIADAARAVPDGYTLLHAPSVITLLPLSEETPCRYDLAKDFDPITVVGLTQFGLVVQSVAARQHGRRADRARQGRARRADLCFRRHRYAAPDFRRAVQDHDRREHPPHSL